MKHGKSGFVGAHGGSGFVAQLLAAGSTLLDGLVSYWTLDETSGVRYDSVGVNDLTDNNTVGAVLRGPEGTVASLVAANNEGLYIPAPGIVLPPQGTVTIWAKVDPAASDGWHSQLIFYNYVLLQCYVSGGKVVFVSGTFYDGNVYQGAGSAWGETYIGDGSGWFLLTVTWDGSTYRVYPNSGANVWSVAGGSPLHDPNQASWISYPAQNWDGELAGCGLWSRAISQEEVATLFASGNGLRYADLPAGLKTGLVSWWELDETSGVRYDSHGSNDLTDNNTVGSVINAGDAMDGAAASFVAANSESLSKASFVAPDDYAISLWMKPTAAAIAAGTTHFFDCGAVWPTNVQFTLAMAGAAIRVTISDGSGYVQKDGLGRLVAGEWTHLIVVYDSATKKASIYMDNDSGAVSDALAGSADRTSATLYVGKFVNGGGSYVYDGILDEVAIWSRVLTDDERAELYAAGAGKFYPFP